MWILDSLSEIELRKPFLVLWISLGAAFLLLANLFSTNPLYHPATFAVLAATAGALWQKEWKGSYMLALVALGATAFLLVPKFQLVYAAAFAAIAGRLVFAQTFRFWKMLVAIPLFVLAVPIVNAWQRIPEIHGWIPSAAAPVLYSALFAFCVQFSFLAYQIRKDSVLEAFGSYTWKTSWNSHHLATEMVALYTKIKTLIRAHETNPKILQDLEDYTERALHQCYRLQEISAELANLSLDSIEQQIIFLSEKINSSRDFPTRMQYEQALQNKKKQKEQYEKLQQQQEHLLSRIINYNSSLENVRFAYANQDWNKTSSATDNVEMFMDLVKARAEAL